MKKEGTSTIHNAEVKKLLYNGFAEAESDIDKFNIAFVLPEEKIVYEKYSAKRKNFFNLQEVTHESPHRVKSPCPYFSICGGCMLQHMSQDFYKNYKLTSLKNILKEQGIEIIPEEIKIVPPSSRRRANLEAFKKDDKLTMGFHKLKNHRLIDIENCTALTHELQKSLPTLRKILEKILEDKEKAKIFLLEINGAIDVGLEIQERKELEDEKICIIKNILVNSNISRFQFRYRKKFLNIYEKNEIFIKHGNLNINIDAWSFAQASEIAEEWMKNIIKYNITPNQDNPQTFLDLFAGRGTFSGVLAEFGNVTAIDGDPKAVENLSNSITDGKISVIKQDLFNEPVLVDKLNSYDTAVIDPPRAGAESQTKELAKSSIKKIIYISCNPESFARDAQILIDGGYCIKKLYPIDQFLWSLHIEIIGIFEKI